MLEYECYSAPKHISPHYRQVHLLHSKDNISALQAGEDKINLTPLLSGVNGQTVCW